MGKSHTKAIFYFFFFTDVPVAHPIDISNEQTSFLYSGIEMEKTGIPKVTLSNGKCRGKYFGPSKALQLIRSQRFETEKFWIQVEFHPPLTGYTLFLYISLTR